MHRQRIIVLARVIALPWMFAGVVFVAMYTAQLTTTLTVRQIRGDKPECLPDCCHSRDV